MRISPILLSTLFGISFVSISGVSAEDEGPSAPATAPAAVPATAAEKFPAIPDESAAPPEQVATPVQVPNGNIESPAAHAGDGDDALWLFLGANLGYTSVSPASSSRESKRSGYAVHARGLLSKYWTRWVADLGVGYQHHTASGRDRFSVLNEPTVKVKTRSAFVEFSPRYRLDRHWQLGAVANGFFGTDVAFDESISRDNKSFALAGGLRADYETNFGKTEARANRWRFGAQILRDLTVADRGIWWFMADVQFGFSLARTPKSGEAGAIYTSAAEVNAAPVAPPKRAVAPRFAEVTPEKAVKIYLGEAVLRFKTASSELRPSSRQILEKVSIYLKGSPDAWKTMRVDGHADKRGKLEYNMRLSKARAERVKRELGRLGVPKEKITTEGFGPTRPIDTEDDLEAYALNRRVELWIDGVNDPDTLVRDLNELK